MDSDRNCESPVLNKNRTRFYSHQVGNEHVKATRIISLAQKGINNRREKFDLSQYIQKQAWDDPNELLEGISDMFINSDMSLNYMRANPEGKF